MKTTVLVQDGNVQLVLTPETDFGREIVEKYGKDFNKVQVKVVGLEDIALKVH